MKYTLRARILLVLLIVFTLLGGTSFIIYRQVLLPSFIKFERQHINTNLLRVVRALENELQNISMLANDWSAWDDTYRYISGHDAGYEESNLTDSAFSINKINLISLHNSSGQKIWGKVVDEDFETAITIQPFDQYSLPADFPLLRYNSTQRPLNEQHATGLIMTSAGPMLCTARPIITSNDTGPPRGTLIMGRLLGQELIEKISRLTDIEYQVDPISAQSKKNSSQEAKIQHELGRVIYQAENNTLRASIEYSDIAGDPALKITVYEERQIMKQGLKAMRMSMNLMFIGIAATLTLMLLVLQRSVVLPLNRITHAILSWRKTKQSWGKIKTGAGASYEINILAEEFDQLITSLQWKNNQLAETNVTLRVESKKLREAQASLKKLDDLKSEFISTAAHELSTPVSSIMGYTELLSDPEMAKNFNEQQKDEFLIEIYDNSERLAKIIDDILDVSRIEAGKSIPLDKSTAATEALFDKVVRRFRLKTKQQITLEVKPEAPEAIVVDVQRINQVMENLLSNAIKYSLGKSKISVVVGGSEKGFCRVTVTDQGIGMSEDQVSQIFDKFYRADDSNASVRGLGLGMSIVKQIIEDHGGEICIDSVPGEGTRVSFTLHATLFDEKE